MMLYSQAEPNSPNSFTTFDNSGYARDSAHAYVWRCSSLPSNTKSVCWHPIAGSDPSSFTALADGYARDRNSAYHRGGRIEGSDSESFIALNVYAKDKTGGYFFGERIAGSDGPTFETLNSIYALDKNTAYCRGKKIADVIRQSFRALGKSIFAVDERTVYVWPSLTDGAEKISQADPLSFEVLAESNYGRDRNNEYYGAKLIEDADAGSFSLVDHNYARDRMRVFYFGKVVNHADPSTFRKLDHAFAVDDKAVFFRGESVTRAERKSFRSSPINIPYASVSTAMPLLRTAMLGIV